MLGLTGLLLLSQGDDAALRARVAAQPPAIRRYVERRAMCNHWGGEPAWDAGRQRQIDRAMRALRCAALDREEAALRRRYAHRRAAIAVIEEAANLSGW
jgi:hypothetical protein